MAYQSLEEIAKFGETHREPFWRAVMLDDVNERTVSEEMSVCTMREMWKAMLEASEKYDEQLASNSGLVGGMGGKMEAYRKCGNTLGGDFMSQVIVQALQMGESNACMKRIVAAPTAGACGVLPAVLVPLYRERHVEEERIIESLFVAAGIGQVIASRAFIAGAAGGCQAEIGSASAMAAGALVSIREGSAEQIMHAAAMALKNLLGLVCDPVRAGRDSMCKTKCNRRSQCNRKCRYGFGRNYEPDSAGSGNRCDAGDRRNDAQLASGNRRGRSGKYSGSKRNRRKTRNVISVAWYIRKFEFFGKFLKNIKSILTFSGKTFIVVSIKGSNWHLSFVSEPNIREQRCARCRQYDGRCHPYRD